MVLCHHGLVGDGNLDLMTDLDSNFLQELTSLMLPKLIWLIEKSYNKCNEAANMEPNINHVLSAELHPSAQSLPKNSKVIVFAL